MIKKDQHTRLPGAEGDLSFFFDVTTRAAIWRVLGRAGIPFERQIGTGIPLVVPAWVGHMLIEFEDLPREAKQELGGPGGYLAKMLAEVRR